MVAMKRYHDYSTFEYESLHPFELDIIVELIQRLREQEKALQKDV
jgi:hypothetical protein